MYFFNDVLQNQIKSYLNIEKYVELWYNFPIINDSEGMFIRKVILSDIFSTEYLDMIVKYTQRIQDYLSSYDVIVFMARKSICFYKTEGFDSERHTRFLRQAA